MKPSNRLRTPIVRDVLRIGLIKLVSIPSTLVVSIMLARNMGPDDFGTYAFIISLTNIAVLTIAGGLPQLITREVAFALQNDNKAILKGLIHSATTWVLCSSVAIMSCGWLAIHFAVTSNEQPLRWALRTALLALPILTLSAVWAGTLRGYGHGAKSQYPSLMLVPIAQLVAITGLVNFGLLSVHTAIITFIFANTLAAAIGLYLTKKTLSDSLHNIAAEYHITTWAKSCVVFTGIALLAFLQTQASVILLGFMSSTIDVAAYQIADRAAQMVILVPSIIELVLAPHIASAFKSGARYQLLSIFRKARWTAGLATLFVAIPLIFAGNPIIQFTYGSAYNDLAVQPLAIISAALLFRAAMGPTSVFMTMMNGEKTHLLYQAFGLTINIVISCLLLSRFGVLGAAYGSAAGTLVWSTLSVHYVRRKIEMRAL